MRFELRGLLLGTLLVLPASTVLSQTSSCEKVRVSLVDHTGATSDRPLIRLDAGSMQPDVFLRRDVSISDLRATVLASRRMCPSDVGQTRIRVLDLSAEMSRGNASNEEERSWRNMLQTLKAQSPRMEVGFGTTQTAIIALLKDGKPIP
jgi:hypothetical protein